MLKKSTISDIDLIRDTILSCKDGIVNASIYTLFTSSDVIRTFVGEITDNFKKINFETYSVKIVKLLVCLLDYLYIDNDNEPLELPITNIDEYIEFLELIHCYNFTILTDYIPSDTLLQEIKGSCLIAKYYALNDLDYDHCQISNINDLKNIAQLFTIQNGSIFVSTLEKLFDNNINIHLQFIKKNSSKLNKNILESYLFNLYKLIFEKNEHIIVNNFDNDSIEIFNFINKSNF